ncbi:hypothetical protein CLU97_2119 [Chryseobacterium sp. 7]|uniref:hypothetical protein n=1 Tax=Chryseobacterium sp. 7 TaxID=2035214 RepID=UPI000EB28F83|nr:hypothetical protein [Chryseobacterium sp. 7]RLJ32658.1 hypothetical protein CLU97_2119 [Chryseobacterium sp. 7]
MKKSLIQELKHKKELFPVVFSNVYPFPDTKKARRNNLSRTISTSIHQSEIYCLRIYKDGINLYTEQ